MPAEARRRGLLIIWSAHLLSIALFFSMTYVVRQGLDKSGNHTMAWALGATGFMTFLASFLARRKLLARATAERRLDLGTTAYIVAFVLCEMTAILGFAAYIITGLSYALHSFIIAVGGMLLHFPTSAALDEIEAGGTANANLNQTTL
ncbi:MAG TPA: hypothetical protein VGO96_03075 [Pyrinomonadaceae bacterium]|jgi:hypothetical protein|nr:hypothetical protein [Pyrinomonadaceae bacterium]